MRLSIARSISAQQNATHLARLRIFGATVVRETALSFRTWNASRILIKANLNPEMWQLFMVSTLEHISGMGFGWTATSATMVLGSCIEAIGSVAGFSAK